MYEVIAIRKLEIRDLYMLAVALTKNVQLDLSAKQCVAKQLIDYGVPRSSLLSDNGSDLALNDGNETLINLCGICTPLDVILWRCQYVRKAPVDLLYVRIIRLDTTRRQQVPLWVYHSHSPVII